jgi:hypothetical protein
MTIVKRVAEGLSEEEAWRLFYQILDALVHMGSMGIVSKVSLDFLSVLTSSSFTEISSSRTSSLVCTILTCLFQYAYPSLRWERGLQRQVLEMYS